MAGSGCNLAAGLALPGSPQGPSLWSLSALACKMGWREPSKNPKRSRDSLPRSILLPPVTPREGRAPSQTAVPYPLLGPAGSAELASLILCMIPETVPVTPQRPQGKNP